MHQILFDFISKYVSLSDEEKNTLIALDIFHSVKKGTVLLKEGQISKDGYFVLKGCIRTYYIIEGEEKTTAFYTEMEGVTPNCVLFKAPSKYYVATTEASIIAVIYAYVIGQYVYRKLSFKKIQLAFLLRKEAVLDYGTAS